MVVLICLTAFTSHLYQRFQKVLFIIKLSNIVALIKYTIYLTSLFVITSLTHLRRLVQLVCERFRKVNYRLLAPDGIQAYDNMHQSRCTNH